MKNSFPTFGNGNGNEKLIPKLWEREWEAGIPGNGREREFPLTPEQNENDLEILISPDLLSKEMKHPPCPNSECSWTKTLKCELFLYILESACNKYTCFHVLLYF